MTVWGDGYPVHHTKNVWEKHVSRIVIPSGVEGSFSLAVRRRASDGEKRETPYHGKWKRRVSRIVIPSEVEGSFSLAVRRSVFDSEERETPCRGKAGAVLPVNGLAKKSGKKGTKKISRCARNDSVGGWLSRASYKECVGKARFPYRHPERSRGIFFVGGKTESV